MKTTQLSQFNNSWYSPGASGLKRLLWFLLNAAVMMNPVIPFSGLRIMLLRLFGAVIGKGVVIKPSVNVKYPWLLEIGDDAWIGEQVWIDNLVKTVIGSDCCLSQGAMLLTGSHNYKNPAFDLIAEPITLENGAWIGAKAIVCPGVTCGSHSVLAAGSVATGNLKPYTIYQGNPATEKRVRNIQ
ncbi:MAG: WcaF family extracellular polysaccharide biosynthesis acetyltransferase [Bacteroidota bacterium]